MKTAEYYVKVYCDQRDIEAINADISIEGPHPMGRIADHKGDLISGSGFHFDTVSGKVERMLNVSKDYRIAKILLSFLTPIERDALLIWEMYVGAHPKDSEKRLNTGKDVAQFLNLNYETLQKNRKRALDVMNEIIVMS